MRVLSFIARHKQIYIAFFFILCLSVIVLFLNSLNDAQRLEYDVRISLNKEKYRRGEVAILTIRNLGKKTVYFGFEYRVRKRINDTWIDISVLGPNEAWPAVLTILDPKRSFKQDIRLGRFDDGFYSLLKEIRHDELEIGTIYFETFSIIE